MSESINFRKVNDGVAQPTQQSVTFPNNVVEAMAILTIHGELEKDEKGVGNLTLRQLCAKCAPRLDGLLREYVCAFGQHGKTVITRYVGMMVMDSKSDEAAARIKQEFNRLVTEAIAEFRPMVAEALQDQSRM